MATDNKADGSTGPVVFVSNFVEVGPRPELEPVDGGLFARGIPKVLDPQIVRERFRLAVQDMTTYLNSLQGGDGPFVLDEVEMRLQMDSTGKVNLVVADVGAGMSGGVTFKWKRRT